MLINNFHKNSSMKHRLKYAIFTLISLLFAMNGFSQTTTAANAPSDFNISINTTLCCIAIVLLFIIIVLIMTVNQAVELYKNNDKLKEKDKNNIKPVVVLAALLGVSQAAFSQIMPAAKPIADFSAKHYASVYFYSFIVVIIVEIAIIIFLLKALRFLTGIEQQQKLKAKDENSVWQKINQLKPLEEEKDLDTGHSYDGIRELDNVIPPWFSAAFVATIIFAIVYLYRYQVAHSAPDQFEEYEAEMHDAKLVQDSLLKLEGNKIDENSVVLLSGADIDAGRAVFMSNCSACHGDKGQGGVGPNLTDEYWLHQGSIKDVFKSIKYGWVEKGMKSWKDDFSAKQIAQLASYIESLKGSNPPNPKEKQGELYVEKKEAPIVDSSAKVTASK